MTLLRLRLGLVVVLMCLGAGLVLLAISMLAQKIGEGLVGISDAAAEWAER